MKTILFTIILVTVLFSNSFSQTEKPITKGHFMVGGLVSFDWKSTKIHFDDFTGTQKHIVFEFSPNFAYFIFTKFAVGLQISSTFEKFTETDGHIDRIRSIAFLPYLRYYMYAGLFVEAAFGYGFEKMNDDNATSVSYKISYGYTFFLSKQVGLEPIVSYTFGNQGYSDIDNKSKVNDLTLSLSLQVIF
ncbi:MAG: hypothetical protein DRI73_03625 [Bacteroidetes bacterium]|nr:MAG: hypothetical protein DRI73_03625 [Bacteroidota bacterium]